MQFRFFTGKNAIILFLQFYRISAIFSEANKSDKEKAAADNEDACASIQEATNQLDKYVYYYYKQKYLGSGSADEGQSSSDNELKMKPIVMKSHLIRNHSYAVVFTPTHELGATCCHCDCHVKRAVKAM